MQNREFGQFGGHIANDMRNRIPTALETYLCIPPETALILLTGTLGCSANWLTARFAGSPLHQLPKDEAEKFGSDRDEDVSIVFVSVLRDAPFWYSELKRTTGIDALKLNQSGRLTFVDCLHVLADGNKTGPILPSLEASIKRAIVTAQRSGHHKVMLILDNPDILLALNLTTSQALNNLLLELRSQVHSTVIACSSDLPLLSPATSGISDVKHTPIEAETAAFVVQQAHHAFFSMSVRELGTGAAKDVSGVLSVTRGGNFYDLVGGDSIDGFQVKEMEALYLVQRDGNAQVFERGSGDI